MNPDSTISAIRPSMIAQVSTTMRGSPARRPRRLRAGLRNDADRLGRDQQVLALGDRQAEHPETEEQRDAQRQPGPDGGAERRQRQAEQEPHEQAEQQPDDGRDELGGRRAPGRARSARRRHDRQVRQDREADDDPGDDQPRAGSRRTRRPANRPLGPPPRATEPDEAAERDAEQTDVADHVFLGRMVPASTAGGRRRPSA